MSLFTEDPANDPDMESGAARTKEEEEEEESPTMNLPVTIGLLISVTVVCVPPSFPCA